MSGSQTCVAGCLPLHCEMELTFAFALNSDKSARYVRLCVHSSLREAAVQTRSWAACEGWPNPCTNEARCYLLAYACRRTTIFVFVSHQKAKCQMQSSMRRRSCAACCHPLRKSFLFSGCANIFMMFAACPWLGEVGLGKLIKDYMRGASCGLGAWTGF